MEISPSPLPARARTGAWHEASPAGGAGQDPRAGTGVQGIWLDTSWMVAMAVCW
jgi:hypothetical protein